MSMEFITMTIPDGSRLVPSIWLRRISGLGIRCILGTIAMLCATLAEAVTLEPESIGGLPGYNSSRVLGISPDGSAVICYAFNNGLSFRINNQSSGMYGTDVVSLEGDLFRWTPETGPQPMNCPHRTGKYHFRLSGVSDGGGVVIGYYDDGTGHDHGFRWSELTGWQEFLQPNGLPVLPKAVSRDGAFVFGQMVTAVTADGHYEFEAFRWTPAGGFERIGNPGLSPREGQWMVTTPDGSAMAMSSGNGPFLWKPAGGFQSLGSVPNFSHYEPRHISVDGMTIAGYVSHLGSMPTKHAAWVWRAGIGMEIVPLLPNSSLGVIPTSVGMAPDGSSISGIGVEVVESSALQHYFRWTPAGGTQNIPGAIAGSSWFSEDGSTGLKQIAPAVPDPIFNYESGYQYALLRVGEPEQLLQFPVLLEPTRDFWASISADGAAVAGSAFILDTVDDPYSANNYTTLYENAYRWLSVSGFVVKDTSRTGTPAGGIPGVTVRLVVGSEVFSTKTTDHLGRVNFAQAEVDLDRVYNVELELNGVVRTYQNIRPSTLISGEGSLVLPLNLRRLFAAELTKLETTGTLVLPYNTTSARSLLQEWNSPLATPGETLALRDKSLARLLTAAEGMNILYGSAEALSLDSGKLIANTLVGLLSVQKAMSELNQQINGELAALAAGGELLEQAAATAGAYVAAGGKIAVDRLRLSFVESTKKTLPPWGTALVDVATGTVLGGFFDAIAEGKWNRAAGNAGGRKALLEGLAENLGEQLGGPVFASAYVSATDDDLATAVTLAHSLDSSVTPVAGFIASTTRANEAHERNLLALDASVLLADTTKKFGYVADLASVVGKAPGAQLAEMFSVTIKGMNVAITAGTAAKDLSLLYQTGFNDVPAVVDLAFHPPAAQPSPLASPTQAAPSISGAPIFAAKLAGNSSSAFAPPTAYSQLLSGLRGALVSADHAMILSAATSLIDEDEGFQDSMEAAVMKIRALARAANPPRPVLDSAFASLAKASDEVHFAQTLLYASVAGVLVPQIADPDMTLTMVISKVDALAQALADFDAALAAAGIESSDVTSPALVMVSEIGLQNAPLAQLTSPGPITIVGKLVNIGSVAAGNVTVELIPGASSGPIPACQLTSTASQSLGTMAAGEVRTVSWNAVATDVSASGFGSSATYRVNVSTSNGEGEGAAGAFDVVVSAPSFGQWIAGHPAADAASEFDDDADGDGVLNGLERYLGRDPVIPDEQGFAFLPGTGARPFSHPRSSMAGSDADASYQWSADLRSWHDSGVEAGGLRVSLTPRVVAGSGDDLKTVVVTPDVVGNSNSLFYRLKLRLKPPLEPEPVPVQTQIISDPQGASLNKGDSVTFTVVATGSLPLLYQWRKNGALIQDANGPSLTLKHLTRADNGTYDVRVVGAGGSVISSGAALSVGGGVVSF
jgi:hypothetical protein